MGTVFREKTVPIRTYEKTCLVPSPQMQAEVLVVLTCNQESVILSDYVTK